MKRTDTLIIGGGQAGLAMSHCLGRRGIDHVVLERGQVGQSWRSERWDSLKLLTPNWQSRLPGFRYRGPDPDGFMSMPELIRYLERYASSFSAPVHEGTTVQSVTRYGDDYRVQTDRGTWIAPSVVLATGYAMKPNVPGMASYLSAEVTQVVPTRYKRPEQLPTGGVLVVGASATGVQLAEEIHRSGRPVTLAVGPHTRLPRHYRGKDIMWWLEHSGILAERADEVRHLHASRSQPSLQLVGRTDRRMLDLGTLREAGVRLTGSVVGMQGRRAFFSSGLPHTMKAADDKLSRLLSRIDDFADSRGLGDRFRDRPSPLKPMRSRLDLDLAAAGIQTVVWATGYRRSYPWLHVPVLDAQGELRHDNGITAADGLYALGLVFQQRRKSNYIDGVGEDAEALAEHIATRMASPRGRAA